MPKPATKPLPPVTPLDELDTARSLIKRTQKHLSELSWDSQVWVMGMLNLWHEGNKNDGVTPEAI